MSIDRYIKIAVTAIAVALFLLVLTPWLRPPQALSAPVRISITVTKEERKRMFSKLTDRDLLEITLLALGDHMGSTPLSN